MSKIKEQQLKEQDNLLEYYSGFYEWLENLKLQTLSEVDIDELEKLQLKTSSTKKRINFNGSSINDANYNNNPLGA